MTVNDNQIYISADRLEIANNYEPGGLIKGLTDFGLAVSPRPVEIISQVAALGLLSGICGNTHNVSGAGTNLYSNLLAPTGSGKDAVSELFNRVSNAIWYDHSSDPFPHIGPGELVSSAGLIRSLERSPCYVAIIGEFGKKLVHMSNPRFPNEYQLGRKILQLFSKSGKNGTFDPMAYADIDKVTKRIIRPSLSLICETTPEGFYSVITPELIEDGMLARSLHFEYLGPRPNANKNCSNAIMPQYLVDGMKNLLAQCNAIRAQNTAYDIEFTPEALIKLDEFDVWTTGQINSGQDVTKYLWNRAHLKAMKLAGIAAISDNIYTPVISLEHVMWATNLVNSQTHHLIGKFQSGEVGEEDGNQAKQHAHIYRIVGKFITTADHGDPKLNKMVASASFPKSWVQQRVQTLPAFKPDARRNLDSALKSLCEADELREMPRSQSGPLFETTARCYSISNPAPFIKAL